MEFLAIVTPNHILFSDALAAPEASFHLLSDKLATPNLKEAKALREILSKDPNLAYGLTHTYLGNAVLAFNSHRRNTHFRADARQSSPNRSYGLLLVHRRGLSRTD